jgi:CopG family nickel-responsive transcriptional regulator
MTSLARVCVSMEKDLALRYDAFANRAGFATRSEATKEAIRKRLVDENWSSGSGLAASIAIVYDHHKPKVMQRLTGIHHRFEHIIIAPSSRA